MNPQLLVDELNSRMNQRLERERGIFRQDHPRASSIGECACEIFHQIKHWSQRTKPNLELQARFNRGGGRGGIPGIEQIVVMELIAEGWPVVQQQLPFEIRETVDLPSGQLTGSATFKRSTIICTGHADLRLEWDGMRPVGEIKSLHPNVFARINSIEDFARMGGFWKRYVHQLPLYCYGQDPPEELGLFILDDCLGHRKVIPMVLEEHLKECQSALDKCRAAVIGILTDEAPPFCTDPTACTGCWAREAGVCCPPLDFSGEGIHVIEDAELADSLARMEELGPASIEYGVLDKALKARMKATGPGEYVAGDFLIRTKTYPLKKHKVPAEVKAKYAWTDEGTITTWSRIEKKDSPDA